MNKKIVFLLIAILLVITVGILAFSYFNKSEKNQTQVAEDVSQSENNTQTQSEQSNTKVEGKTLIVYFSHSGNTQTVANIIHDIIGGDIIELETEKTYPNDYNELLDIAQEEQSQNARPSLSTKIENIDEYDIIILGYPNWWADMPMAVYSFLDEYDLSGKTIAPFITHGGSGLSGTPRTIQSEEPNATVTEGLAINGNNAQNSRSAVEEWLNKLGF